MHVLYCYSVIVNYNSHYDIVIILYIAGKRLIVSKNALIASYM